MHTESGNNMRNSYFLIKKLYYCNVFSRLSRVNCLIYFENSYKSANKKIQYFRIMKFMYFKTIIRMVSFELKLYNNVMNIISGE